MTKSLSSDLVNIYLMIPGQRSCFILVRVQWVLDKYRSRYTLKHVTFKLETCKLHKLSFHLTVEITMLNDN